MQRFLKLHLVVVFLLCFMMCACTKTPQDNINLDYGKPMVFPYPSTLWQTTIGGSQDDYVKDVFCYDGFIYIIGETNSYDINFTATKLSQKLFLGRLDWDGQIKDIWTFAASDKQNSIIKSIIIDEYLFVLSECALNTKSVALLKVNLKNGQAKTKVLGSSILDEDALDLIHHNNKIYVIGQNFERNLDSRNLFVEQVDFDLNQQNYQRIVRSSDLKYIGCVKTKDAVNIWINAVAIKDSYPVMIDITNNEYIYHNFEKPLKAYRLLDAKPLGNKTLLIFAQESQNNKAVYCFFENGKFQNIRHISKDNIISGKIIPNNNYATVFLDSQSPNYYLVNENFVALIKNLNQEPDSEYKNFEPNISALLCMENNRQKIIIMKDYNTKIINLEILENITAFWIEKDYIIAVSNTQNPQNATDIKVMLIKAMPYQFLG